MKVIKEDLEELGYNPYHYTQSGDYVEDEEGGFRKFQGATGRVVDFTYPIFRLDTDKLLSRIDNLNAECEKYVDALNAIYESGIVLNEHEDKLRVVLGIDTGM